MRVPPVVPCSPAHPHLASLQQPCCTQAQTPDRWQDLRAGRQGESGGTARRVAGAAGRRHTPLAAQHPPLDFAPLPFSQPHAPARSSECSACPVLARCAGQASFIGGCLPRTTLFCAVAHLHVKTRW